MYKSLQAGRAFAAILVVLFHLGLTIAKKKYFGIAAFSIPFSFGTSGVEFFFVLSGFIILTAHQHDIFKPDKLANYISKRLIRIYPTYWIIFLSVFLLAIVSTALRNKVPHDPYILVKSLLLIPQDKDIVGGTGAPVLDVAWTLQYEMFFYIFFICLILSRWLSVIVGLSLLYVYIIYSGSLSLSFPLSFISQDYILLFGMGMAVSITCSSRTLIVDSPGFFAGFGAVIILVAALDTVLKTNILSEHRTIIYGLASCLIIFGLVKLEDKGRIIGGYKWIQILGDSSYALYLLHVPLISVLCKLSTLIQLNKLEITGAVIAYFLIFGACLICSVAFHIWIEEPVTRYLRNCGLNRKFVTQQNA